MHSPVPEHPLIPLPGPRNRKSYLKEYGFKHRKRVHIGTILLAGILLLSIGVAVLVEWKKPEWLGFTGTDLAVAIAALGALGLGYQQWHEARHESSLDRYYERLDIANRRGERSRSVYEMTRSLPPENTEPDIERMMYVYAELDNLEYVIIKYKLGYMRPGLACRALRTFQRRCYNPDFRRLALERVQSGDYNARTAKVVKRVCHEVEVRLTSAEKKSVQERPELQLAGTAPPRKPTALLPRAAGLWPAISGLLFLLLGFLRHR